MNFCAGGGGENFNVPNFVGVGGWVGCVLTIKLRHFRFFCLYNYNIFNILREGQCRHGASWMVCARFRNTAIRFFKFV
jgi:hypothetical protein